METVNAIIRRQLAASPEVPVADAGEIEAEHNLLDLIDSFGFAHFLMDLEVELGVTLDMSRVALSELTRLDRLTAHFEALCEGPARSQEGASA